MQMREAVDYMMRFKFLPDGFMAKPEIDKIIDANGWKK
jgi:hypothetical protein